MSEPSNDICIAVATHKPYRMPQDSMYLPLHVGAALHPEILPDMQGDDTGDNISDLNASYSELTGLYWVWKNVEASYKGLVHYRRLLGSADVAKRHEHDPYDRLVDADELRSLLAKKDVVVAKHRNYVIENIYDHYAHTFDATHFDLLRELLAERCPSYVSAWDQLMKSTRVHVFNMFVMPASLFDDYCGWLFPLVNELSKRIDSSEMDAFDARWPGRVSERMLDPWLMTNGITYEELPVVSPESVNWAKKGSAFLAAKFFGKKYEESF
jgi:hypothetical protein